MLILSMLSIIRSIVLFAHSLIILYLNIIMVLTLIDYDILARKINYFEDYDIEIVCR